MPIRSTIKYQVASSWFFDSSVITMIHGPVNIRVNSTPSGEAQLETKLLMSQKLFAVVMTVTVMLMEIYRTKPLSRYGRRVLGSDLTPTFI